MRKGIIFFVIIQVISLAAFAEDDVVEYATPIDYSTILIPQTSGLANTQLAMVEQGPVQASLLKPEQKKYEERLFTWNKSHMYLGMGSLGLAALAVLSPKTEGNDTPHHLFATGAAYLGVGAVATGLVFHLDDIDLSKGFKDPDNLHLLLGVIGTLGYILAVDGAPDSMHATYGSIGIASMLFAVKLTW